MFKTFGSKKKNKTRNTQYFRQDNCFVRLQRIQIRNNSRIFKGDLFRNHLSDSAIALVVTTLKTLNIIFSKAQIKKKKKKGAGWETRNELIVLSLFVWLSFMYIPLALG